VTFHRNPSQQAEIVRRIRQGEKQSAIAAELGVHPNTVRQWVRSVERAEETLRAAARNAEPVTPEKLDPALPLEGGDLLVSEGPRSEPGTPAALARSLAALDDDDEKEAGKPVLEGPAALLQDMSKPGQLTNVAEGLNGMVVKFACVKYRVRLKAEDAAAFAKFTPEERDALDMFEPYARPYVQAQVQEMAPFAALLFAGMFALAAWSRIAAIGERAAQPIGSLDQVATEASEQSS
jgi:DNA-binding transcriptional regulator YdaS (Cro superfamily)